MARQYGEQMWIVKDGVKDRGEGVTLITDLKDVPRDNKNILVQQYIQYPYLVNGFKFTSVLRARHQLRPSGGLPVQGRLRAHGDGQVRSRPAHLWQPVVRFTNPDINKKREPYASTAAVYWSIQELFTYMEERATTPPTCSSIRDMLAKTILAAEPKFVSRRVSWCSTAATASS